MPDNTSMFNSGIMLANYVGYLEIQASQHMMSMKLFEWYKVLEALLVIGASKFPKEDTNEIRKALDKINPHDLTEYKNLQNVMLVLNKHLDKYGFLSPKGDDPRTAVWRR